MRSSTEDTMNSFTPQQYCLRWKYHHSNLQAMFSQLLERESYCDVTLACEGKTLRAHKIMLSACSTYFDSILSQHDENKAIVILKDVKFSDIQALVSFMYKGEINVDHTELSSLLKTAEELKIKGLAEVSWRSDQENQISNINSEDGTSISKKRKLDSTPTPATTSANVKTEFTEKQKEIDDMVESDADENESEPDQSIWEPDLQHDVDSDNVDISRPATVSAVTSFSSEDDPGNNTSINQTFNEQPGNAPDLSQFSDVTKMNDYLEKGGRRPQFWEESFTKRLMEAIKNKEVEMKVAAELMGVSYGTLYGRYRDAYGCLKHPYRVRDFWLEQGPADVLAKLQRKELTLFRAAEILNVTVTTLASYLSTIRNDSIATTTAVSSTERSTFSVDAMSESDREEENSEDEPSNDDMDNIITTSNTQQNNSDNIISATGAGTLSKVNNLNGN